MAQQQALPVGSRRGQDGSRWYNERPEAKDVAKWFKDSVPLDEGMVHSRYVGGVTLIEGWERTEEMRAGQNGNVFATKVRNLAFTPYMKVDTRALYFKDWCLANKYIGEVVPAVLHEGMRPGFFTRVIGSTEFVGCAFQVRVWERYDMQWREGQVVGGRPVMLGAPASKLVPILTKVYDNGWKQGPDVYADMKAETGALGRALGMAGMLVVPGSGVATAEDIQEMIGRDAVGGVLTDEDRHASPSLPAAVAPPEALAGEASAAESQGDPDEGLRAEVERNLKALKEASPDDLESFQRWAREDRKFDSLADVSGPQLRGVARKVAKLLADAQAK